MAYGFGTWDASGNYSNNGLIPVNILGYFRIDENILNATFNFSIPAGFTLRFVVMPDSSTDGVGDNRRRIYVSGNSIIVEPAPNNVSGTDRFPLNAMYIMGYIS
ncbi:hypothetical protein [Pantoea sp. GD03673]|uniref:hypothetical protein n=1 Tax=Pantoea sp. GD03673 TaxID=2975364 RepID=UPI002447A4B3|nr:hypothetical protein [Pantoea sp. GD03673]MDH2066897.1 hypothetical protein [Pantoea sp. GD03673]